jgi:uncharacterized coiled-coil protein SlyX
MSSNSNGERPITPKSVQFVLTILIPLLTLAVTWGALGMRISNLETRLAEQAVKTERAETALTEIKVSLARIETDISYVRKQVEGGKP